ncbi:mitochondrial fusion [Homalodisca vitripennis]|nr:mitochondrial fusion [Homalodisca vitripennis]
MGTFFQNTLYIDHCLNCKDTKDFMVAYEEMLLFLQEKSCWTDVETELSVKGVKAMTFYDVVMDYILMDAFEDLDTPPSSVTAVVQNRWLSNGFKESPTAMHLSLKGFLRTPETHHEAHQSTTSAVPQTAENNLSTSWENSPPLSKLPKMAYRSLAIAGQSKSRYYTFYRVDPPEGCRLCEDASSGDHAP